MTTEPEDFEAWHKIGTEAKEARNKILDDLRDQCSKIEASLLSMHSNFKFSLTFEDGCKISMKESENGKHVLMFNETRHNNATMVDRAKCAKYLLAFYKGAIKDFVKQSNELIETISEKRPVVEGVIAQAGEVKKQIKATSVRKSIIKNVLK